MTVTVSQHDLAFATLASSSVLLAANAVAMNHPDAEIIALAVEYEHARAAREAHHPILEAAEALYVEPTIPAALMPRRGDPLSFGPCRRQDGTWWYINLVHQFRTVPVTRPATTDDGERIEVPYPQAQARADEIVAAYDQWRAECDRAKSESGFAAADEQDTRLYERMWELHDALSSSQPKTLEGVQAKARGSMLRHDLFETEEECCSDKELALSIVRDIVRLDEASSS